MPFYIFRCHDNFLFISVIAERALESVINKTVEQVILVHLNPRTAINVTIQEMQSDGLVSIMSLKGVHDGFGDTFCRTV